MKYILAILSFCFLSMGLYAQQGIQFNQKQFSFGKVKKDKPVTHVFEFTNTGKKPLIIEDAVAECGCTKPEFPKQPVMPGKKGTVKVTYDAKTMGSFTKKVTVSLVNQKDPVVLVINGEVI